MRAYHRLTEEHHIEIYALKKAGFSQKVIASRIGVHKSTVSRELKRNESLRGYRTGEPIGVARENSIILKKVLRALWGNGLTKSCIAKELNIPWEEVETLVFDLAGKLPPPSGDPQLRAVK